MTVARLSTSTTYPIRRRPTGLRAAASHLGLALIAWSHRGTDQAAHPSAIRRRMVARRDAELVRDRAVATALQMWMR